MYIPPHFSHHNRSEQLQFIQSHPFGLLLCNDEDTPAATHLPFTLEESGEKLLLHSHLSAANPQALLLKSGIHVKVVFGGPHAYISPELYDHARNVPTWNYVSVHASGICRVLNDVEASSLLLERTIAFFEPGWQEKFRNLDPAYFSGLLKGIVAFTVEVDQLEAKYKLSQNKTSSEKERIIAHLLQSEDPAARELGETMNTYYTNSSATE
ncbi:MAG: FMN-binding negative transcriptional regulator [Bacteroidetes bacterium]|nr:FMN-binding negative transcriptional regulator [Bacteroidota bacterium]